MRTLDSYVRIMLANRSDIKSRLWEAASILRGSALNRTDWKAYILPLLYLQTHLRCLGRRVPLTAILEKLESARYSNKAVLFVAFPVIQ